MLLAQPAPVLAPSKEEQAALKELNEAMTAQYAESAVDERVRRLQRKPEPDIDPDRTRMLAEAALRTERRHS